MFKQRLLTTLVLIPLVLLLIYYATSWVVTCIALLLVFACGWEWLKLIPIHQLLAKVIFISMLLVVVTISLYKPTDFLITGLVLWGFILLAVITYPASEPFWGHRLLVGASGLFLLPIFAHTLVATYQHEQGRAFIVYVLCLVWAADIGAYLVGKRFGHHKLIPLVSPGKTVEGTLGGVVLVLVVSMVGSFYFKPASLSIWVAIAFSTALISILGDLFISMLKRRTKLKDTGHLIPGHGGVLDRLDSLIAAVPFFYYGLTFLGQ